MTASACASTDGGMVRASAFAVRRTASRAALTWRRGGLLSYAPDWIDLFRRAAPFIVKILRDGARPGDLPIEQPTRFELVVNLRAARTLGLTIPQSVLLRADEVLQ